jgi:gamma-glutamyltranspeptidase
VDWEIHTAPPPHYGGASLLLALGVAEALELHRGPRRQDSGITLFEELATLEAAQLPAAEIDPESASSQELLSLARCLSREHADALAVSIRRRRHRPVHGRGALGTHTLAVADSEGNLVVGLHSINWTARGIGLFVGGVCLNAGGHNLYSAKVSPGRRLGGQSCPFIATRGGSRHGVAAHSTGLLAATLQYGIDALGRGLALAEAIASPRWGGPAFDTLSGTSAQSYGVEESFPEPVVEAADHLGAHIERATAPALGYLSAVAVGDDGARTAVGDPRFRGQALGDDQSDRRPRPSRGRAIFALAYVQVGASWPRGAAGMPTRVLKVLPPDGAVQAIYGPVALRRCQARSDR